MFGLRGRPEVAPQGQSMLQRLREDSVAASKALTGQVVFGPICQHQRALWGFASRLFRLLCSRQAAVQMRCHTQAARAFLAGQICAAGPCEMQQAVMGRTV